MRSRVDVASPCGVTGQRDSTRSLLCPHHLAQGLEEQNTQMSPCNSTKPIPGVPTGRTGITARRGTVPVPCCHLARRDMVLSLGHIHRSEEPPSTASVIAGHPGLEFGDSRAPLTVTSATQRGPQPLCSQVPREEWSFRPGCRGKTTKSLKITLGKALFVGL